MIRIYDRAERLDRLNVMYEEREIDEGEFQEEFKRVCLRIWELTPDDVDEYALAPADLRWFEELTEESAVEFARANGYDLLTHDGRVLDDWEWFMFMILATLRGVIADTPEKRAALKLRREADEHAANRRAGILSGR